MENQRPELVHEKETLLFAICIITAVLVTLYLLFSIIGIIIFIFFALLSFFSHAISISHIQLNGIRLREKQFPELYKKVETLSQRMELKQIPEVYIVESGGTLNAFATKVFALFGKNMVVLYSDFVDISLESNGSEIDYVIAHELAHIKRNHIVKTLLVFPAMWVPFVGVGFSRMAEFTCDRMAAYYTDEPDGAVNGLLVLAAGRRLYKDVNIEEYQQQYNEKKGFFATMTELLSTHPPIPKRINEIEKFLHGEPSIPLVKKTKQLVAIMLTIFVLLPALSAGLFFAGFKILENVPSLDWMLSAEDPPLQQAIFNEDLAEAEQLLIDGADPNEMNEYGETALTLAISYDETDFIPTLLEHGADPNLQDEYGWTPLMSAVSMENLEAVKILLEAGADPTLVDSEGMSALDYAKDYGYGEFVELLKSVQP
ncbi:hypothetical protein CVD25_09565 [Bacillus canaveralius]|uniref:Peptidase M48 domain-containing protein n=1 Tax=Bacillus canaveralius TaxID=1403243 RepID=A0A2N5GGK0_9BACI|nr:M48 family metallopeptidase [Bacillus canaveralius]PLR79861.1 hypothetical protein CU635_21005 [Bacillus canaveralius]PLR97790.1 hypothetical protein CVD25_09565 [Bacillus canaveralius]RSK45571.1 hypothetical protein EJA13_19285 [Bacillus canaveralius]